MCDFGTSNENDFNNTLKLLLARQHLRIHIKSP